MVAEALSVFVVLPRENDDDLDDAARRVRARDGFRSAVRHQSEPPVQRAADAEDMTAMFGDISDVFEYARYFSAQRQPALVLPGRPYLGRLELKASPMK